MRLTRYIRASAALMLAALTLLCSVCTAYADDGHRTKNVRVGYYYINNFSELSEEGIRSGYGYEYLQNMLLYADWKYEYSGYGSGWGELQEALRGGRIDMMLAAAKTSQREEYFAFSERPICTASACLVINPLNTDKYSAGDYESYNNLRVGIVREAVIKDSIDEFAEQNNIKLNYVYFDSLDRLGKALAENTDIDAAITSDMAYIDNTYVLERFDSLPLYIMVRKEDTVLLDEVNYAMRLLDQDYPRLKERLLNKYYDTDSYRPLAFTQREKEYIRQCDEQGRIFKAAVCSDREPYVIKTADGIGGIWGEIVNEVIEKTGLNVEITTFDNYHDYVDAINGGEYELCLDMGADLNFAEKHGYTLTGVYYEATVSRLTLRSLAGDAETAVMPYECIQVNPYPSMTGEKEYCDTVDECIAKVKAGETDAAYLYSLCAQQASYRDITNRLAVTSVAGTTTGVSIGVKSTESWLLSAVISRAVQSYDTGHNADITNRYASDYNRKQGGMSFFYNDPLSVVLLLVFFFVMLIIILTLAYSVRSKRAELARAYEFERFIGYVCNANDDVAEVNLVKNTKTRYRLVNGKVKKDVSKAQDDVLSLERLHPDDVEGVRNKCTRDEIERIISECSEIRFECRLSTTDGGYKWYSCLVMGIASDAEHPMNYMVFVRDINDIKEAERLRTDEYASALEKANAANEAKSAFLARMSHDMRTPMNGLLGLLYLLEDETLSDSVREQLKKMENTSHYLLSLINDTLDMSKIESNKITLNCEAVDSREFLDLVISSVTTSIAEKKINFTVTPINMKFVTVNIDKVRIQQIFTNVLSNAVKFTPDGGKIELELECISLDDKYAHDRVTVRDNGIGMSEEFMKKLFVPFEQEYNGVTVKTAGTGLGLSIVKNLVTLMGGRIEVKSKKGEGTEVTVWLDFERARDDEIPKKPEISHPLAKDMRILLCEDNMLNAEIAIKLLTKFGCITDRASDGGAGAKMFADSAVGYYNAILMDIRMPVMDGYETTETIRAMDRADAKTIPIIAMTANAFDEDVIKARESGMNAHLAKPIDPSLLFSTLEELAQ